MADDSAMVTVHADRSQAIVFERLTSHWLPFSGRHSLQLHSSFLALGVDGSLQKRLITAMICHFASASRMPIDVTFQ